VIIWRAHRQSHRRRRHVPAMELRLFIKRFLHEIGRCMVFRAADPSKSAGSWSIWAKDFAAASGSNIQSVPQARQQTVAVVSDVEDEGDSFRIVSESKAYSRYLQVEDREVEYPDGRRIAFDIVGHVSDHNASARRRLEICYAAD
jgi:hypothetical protein